jgi:Sigma-54 interaction domain
VHSSFTINCAAVSPGKPEPELFGNEPSSFAEAHGGTRKVLGLTQNGTLIRNELTGLSLVLQAKLLTFPDMLLLISTWGRDSHIDHGSVFYSGPISNARCFLRAVKLSLITEALRRLGDNSTLGFAV